MTTDTSFFTPHYAQMKVQSPFFSKAPLFKMGLFTYLLFGNFSTSGDTCNGSVHINEPDFAIYNNTISQNDSCGDFCYENVNIRALKLL